MRAPFYLLLPILLSLSSALFAGDFDWIDSLSISASKNDSGYRTRLGVRFHIGDAEVKAVIRDSGGKADAYMVLRLAELSHQPREKVIKSYRRYRKAKAWGKLAKSLGIKPGSKAFHELKRGHDLGDWNNAKKETHRDGFHAEKPRGKAGHSGGKALNHKKGNRNW